MPDPDLTELNAATDEYLRRLAAHVAGILAAREGGYAPKTAAAYRRIADRLEAKPRESVDG